ncbi:hypothetical protein [Halorarius halobius]|uniref:hypothetical protein n=1 Tax=Halorarius halobius TaxID=2962671 RepID=UPI0020CD6BEC|nr:hypothetical protein [Halorarius halobius]
MPSIESFSTKRGTARFTEDAVHFDESAVGYIRSLYREYWKIDILLALKREDSHGTAPLSWGVYGL